MPRLLGTYRLYARGTERTEKLYIGHAGDGGKVWFPLILIRDDPSNRSGYWDIFEISPPVAYSPPTWAFRNHESGYLITDVGNGAIEVVPGSSENPPDSAIWVQNYAAGSGFIFSRKSDVRMSEVWAFNWNGRRHGESISIRPYPPSGYGYGFWWEEVENPPVPGTGG